jgi:hydrogenase nickel incorporation protein HypA/HybF
MRLTRIGVRVGELAGVDPDALTFSFAALVKETDLEKCILEIESVPRRHACPGCGERFVVRNSETRCPRCGAARTIFISGNELEFTHLEMEEV